MIFDNPIPELVARYRKLKAQSDAVKADMDSVKAELLPMVEAQGGKWKDGDGYARLVEYKPSVSYDSKAVEALAEAWCKSDDAVMKSCGEMLQQHRKERSGYTSFQIK